MKYLIGQEEQEALIFIDMAAKIALSSPCFRSRCGSVIVKNNKVIGSGFNSPPKGKVLSHCLKDDLPKDFKSDRTCCIHAEQRAIMDALQNNHKEIIGSRLYFIRLDETGKKTRAGDLYCTICSKMALDAGLAEFVLWQEKGICVYNTDEYNNLSFLYKEKP